jgi:geranylgeranyl pyrophosphate synthase
MSKTVSPIFRTIEPDLDEVEERLREASALEHPFLRGVLEHVLLAPGKRIRPALTLASGRMFRESGVNLWDMATAVELLHTATLIHDDVVDQTDLRRGSATLFSVVGNSVAVLVGDYLFAKAAETAAQTNNVRIMRLFADSVMTLCAGQIDEAARSRDVLMRLSRDRYYETIDAKTAALFVFACRAGAILGEATMAQSEALTRYAKSLGLAFQVVDDVLDLIGDEAEMGKPAGSDLRQGVVTLPIIYLRDELPESVLLQALDGDGARDEAIETITRCARSSRAVARAQEEAERLADEAAAALEGLPPGDARDLLFDLTRSVVDRRA